MRAGELADKLDALAFHSGADHLKLCHEQINLIRASLRAAHALDDYQRVIGRRIDLGLTQDEYAKMLDEAKDRLSAACARVRMAEQEEPR